MKHLFLAVLLLSCTTLLAQKKEKLAYYDADSILKIWPERLEQLDSLENYKENVRGQLISIWEIYMRKDSALKADSAKLAPETYALRKNELVQMRKNTDEFLVLAEQELKLITAKFDSLCAHQMQQAALTAAKKKGYKLVETKNKALQMEAVTPETNYEMMDITTLVMVELKIAIPFRPKR